MTKKAAPKIYFILLLLFILLTGCSDKKVSESSVSPEAEAVITQCLLRQMKNYTLRMLLM